MNKCSPARSFCIVISIQFTSVDKRTKFLLQMSNLSHIWYDNLKHLTKKSFTNFQHKFKFQPLSDSVEGHWEGQHPCISSDPGSRTRRPSTACCHHEQRLVACYRNTYDTLHVKWIFDIQVPKCQKLCKYVFQNLWFNRSSNACRIFITHLSHCNENGIVSDTRIFEMNSQEWQSFIVRECWEVNSSIVSHKKCNGRWRNRYSEY